MEFYKYKCSDCGSTRFDKTENGYRCKYCGNIQDVIFTKEEKKSEAETEIIEPEIQEEVDIEVSEKKSFVVTEKFKSSLIRLIICLLGGWFGLHKFIKGEIFWGFVYMFTGGLFGIGYVIDLICAVLNLSSSAKTGEK